MKVTLEILLKEQEKPDYSARVNHALQELLQNDAFLDGRIDKIGSHFWFPLDGVLTEVIVSYA